MNGLGLLAWASRGRTGRLAARFGRDRSGVIAIEFAIVALPFAFMIFSILELGIVFMLSMSLESATAKAARSIRTGTVQQAGGGSITAFRDAICAEMGWLETQCPSSLSVDVRKFTTFSDATGPNPIKRVDGKLTFDKSVMTYDAGKEGDIVLVRAFYQWPLITPFAKGGLERISGGKTLMTAAFTFRNEPYK